MRAAPPEDPGRSPFTGWTRDHWEHTADLLLEGVRQYATPDAGLIHLPGGRESMSGRRSDGLEGFARTFLMGAFRIRGASGLDVGSHIDFYASGLEAGTSQDEKEAWPPIEDLSQPMVEAASIAIGLYETKPWIWDRLSDEVRERTVAWLSGVHDKRFHQNNWLLFNVMVNCFLKSAGAAYRQDEIDHNLDLIDAMYRGDGWYSDGHGSNFDHYVGWAMHLYTILWCRMDGDVTDPSRAAGYRKRLHRFLDDYRCLFASNGAPLQQGRSLIYRFAAAAPVWAGALAGATPLPPGETRRLATGALRYFLDQGAARDGVLTMGWHREFLPMAQAYSGPGSPYWASKGFLGLLIPPDDPVWTDREEPLACEREDFVRAMPVPGFVAHAADGIVRVASHRSDRFPWSPAWGADPNYRKLSYSTHTAPEVGEIGAESDLDAQVCLVSPDGERTRRARIHPIALGDCFAASVHFPHEGRIHEGRWLPGWHERIETVAIARGPSQIHIHHVSTTQERTVQEGGFAVAGDAAALVEIGDVWCIARDGSRLVSGIFGLQGFDEAGAQTLEGNNALGEYSATPWIRSAAPTGAEAVLVSMVYLGKGDPFAARDEIVGVRVERRKVRIACNDGSRYEVNLVEQNEGVRFEHNAADGSKSTVP